jgi:hypothetical protein
MAALILSACAGSSRTPTSSQSSCAHQGRHALAFAGCMRSHGVPAYRDPQVLLVVHQSTSRVGVAPWRRKATGCRPGPRLIAEVAAVLLFLSDEARRCRRRSPCNARQAGPPLASWSSRTRSR